MTEFRRRQKHKSHRFIFNKSFKIEVRQIHRLSKSITPPYQIRNCLVTTLTVDFVNVLSIRRICNLFPKIIKKLGVVRLKIYIYTFSEILSSIRRNLPGSSATRIFPLIDEFSIFFPVTGGKIYIN